jgi:hypothetical protein
VWPAVILDCGFQNAVIRLIFAKKSVMRNYFFYAVVLLVLASCGGKKGGETKTVPRKVDIKSEVPAGNTANQQTGIKAVTRFFGGVCKVTTGTDGEKDAARRFIKVEMSHSGALDTARNITELNTANIAMMFYTSLEGDISNYDEVITVILFSDNQSIQKVFPVPTLNMVLRKTRVVMDIVDALRDKKYDRLGEILNDDNGILKYNKKMLLDKIQKVEPSLGNVKSFVPYGFVFLKSDTKKDILRISGTILRDIQNHEFSVDIDTNAMKDEAMFINYKL